MKSRYVGDERAMNSQGRPSRSRVFVLEALDTVQKEGATIDELANLIGADLEVENPKMSIGQALSRMEADEHVICRGQRWYLKEHQPVIPTSTNGAHGGGPAPYASNGQRAQIAPMVQKRSGKQISFYTAPQVCTDVISLALLIKEQWFEIPFFGALRVCVGHTIPDWSSEKRWYYNVSVVKMMFKDGKTEEKHPDSKDVVTIDLEE